MKIPSAPRFTTASSFVRRSHSSSKCDIRSESPGPGAYSCPSDFGKSVKGGAITRSSRTDLFKGLIKESITSPAPNAYSVKQSSLRLTIGSKFPRTPRRSASHDRRFHEVSKSEDVPGPGRYSPVKVANATLLGSFGKAPRRCVPQFSPNESVAHMPAPNLYKPPLPPSRHTNNTGTFGRAPRMSSSKNIRSTSPGPAAYMPIFCADSRFTKK